MHLQFFAGTVLAKYLPPFTPAQKLSAIFSLTHFRVQLLVPRLSSFPPRSEPELAAGGIEEAVV